MVGPKNNDHSTTPPRRFRSKSHDFARAQRENLPCRTAQASFRHLSAMKIEISCLIAAVLFFVSNAIGFSLFNVIRHESGGTWGNYHFLEPHLISSEVSS